MESKVVDTIEEKVESAGATAVAQRLVREKKDGKEVGRMVGGIYSRAFALV